jgi:UDPglucose 6-dehydrogenase
MRCLIGGLQEKSNSNRKSPIINNVIVVFLAIKELNLTVTTDYYKAFKAAE